MFRGLLPFDETERDRFFGRDHDIAAFVERLEHADCRYLVLLGESGAGKSSFLRAGIMPVLRARGRLPIYLGVYPEDPTAELIREIERHALLTPAAEESAIETLARAAAELDTKIVLFFDQFESLLIDSAPPPRRAAFLRLLADSHARSSLPLRIVISIRQDFIYRLLELEQTIGGWIPQPLAINSIHTLRRLERQQAVEVLERTCDEGGMTVESALLRELARDLAVGGSVLPFELQVVGSELERRGLRDCATYRRAGGKAALVDGFLDEVIQGSGNSVGALRLLLSLVADDGRRRSRSAAEIAAATRLDVAATDRLLGRFVQARLVSVDQRSDPWRYALVHDQLALRVQRLAGELTDARDRANRQLRQYVAGHRLDPTTTIPLTKLWRLRHHGDPPGEEGRDLIRRSLRKGLGRAAALAAGIAITTLALTAPFSITHTWDSTVLRDGHRAAAKASAVSPDGSRLATGGEDGRLILWDLASRLPVAEAEDHGSWVHDVAFSPDGRTLASIGSDLRVALRDVSSLEPRAWLSIRAEHLDHRPNDARLGFSPGGRYLAAWVGGVGTRVWRVHGPEPLPPITAANVSGTPLFSPDERWLISPNGTTWEIEPGRPVAELLPTGEYGNFGALSHDGTLLASVSSLGLVTVFDLVRFWEGGSRGLVAQHRSHRDHGRSVAFSRDDASIATGAEDICLFDRRGKHLRARFPYAAIVWDLVFGHDGDQLISAHGDGAVLIWDVSDHRIEARLGSHGAAVRGVAFSPDGRWLATASEDRTILIWDLASRRIEAILMAHETRINAIVFAADGMLYSADQNGDVIGWDLERGEQRWRTAFRWGAPPMPSPIYALAPSPDSRWLAINTGVVDAATGERIFDFEPDHRPPLSFSRIYGLRFTPTGEHLAIATTDGDVHLLRAPDWRFVGSGSAGEVTLVALDVSPDGRSLVTGENEGAIRLWSVDPLEPIAILGNHTSRVKSVAFSPDGSLVASAGDDRRLMLWDPARRRPGREVSTGAAPMLSVAFSPDGTRLATGSHDGSTRLFDRHDQLWGWRLP